MLALVLALAVLIGIALGLLGGGGSILTVPILLYAAELEPKVAIAMSLLVVGATSAAALVPHARAGQVRWRIGLTFGATAMVGAFAGGLAARFIPAWVLLLAFAGMMVATAIAMLRGGPRTKATPHAPLPFHWIALEGVAVGAFTGMVGAGGGFLVVPALVLLGGLSMREAIGTSLLVIAMKSMAGFAGYAAHVPIDYGLAAAVTGAAIVGALVGAMLGKKVSAETLRTGFGWFVALMGLYMVGRQLRDSVITSDVFRAVFVDRWPWFVGGAAIGGVVLALLYVENKLLGVSTGYSEMCALTSDPATRRSWRMPLLIGIVFGGLAAALIASRAPTFSMGVFDAIWSGSPLVKGAVLLGGGALVGFGARTAGGCTSGHGIVGVAQGARSSLLATAMFMVAGFAVTQLVVFIAGV
jgi:uncharacterized membrane protein YfcA/uncharacterized membrane protein YedE/YeeE